MSLRSPVRLEHPQVSPEDVHRAVFRFAASGGFTGSDRVELIAPTRAAGSGSVTGPDGFSLTAVRLRAGTASPPMARMAFTALHVVEGSLSVDVEGDVTVIAARDTILIAPGLQHTMQAQGAGDCRFIEMEFAERGDTHRRVHRSRIGRLGAMVPVRDRFPVSLASGINDVLSPRTLYPVIGPVARGPGRFEIVGPDELVVALATTPRGTGPALHVHRYSTEMFVVLAGQFRITWGDHGEHETLLDPLDAIVVPRGVNRAFEAAGSGENWILPVVVGTNDESEDIVFFPEVEERLRAVGRLAALVATSTRVRIGERAARTT